MQTAEEILNQFEPNREYPNYYHESDVLKAMEEYHSLPSGVTEQQLEEMAESFAYHELYGKQNNTEQNLDLIAFGYKAGFKAKAPVSEWVKVEDGLPTEKDADENGKVLVWREMNDSQKSLSKSVFDYWMVKNCDSSTFWMPLPTPPTTK